MTVEEFFDKNYDFVLGSHPGYSLSDISDCPNDTLLDTIPREDVIQSCFNFIIIL